MGNDKSMNFHKYKAAPKERRTLDGMLFASRAEMLRYKELKMLEKAGVISNLELQPKFLLVPKNGKERAVNYVADFQYIEEGKDIVEDVKGAKTKEYIIKRKLFKLKYPQYIFRETKAYKK